MIENHLERPLTPAISRQKQAAGRSLFQLPPGARFVSDFDPTYNCVGFAFASRRVFVHPDQLPVIIEGDDYVEVAPEAVAVGDVATWQDGEEFQHVGLIVGTRRLGAIILPEVLSKWASEGQVLHGPMAVPAIYGDRIRYWRIRR